MVSVHLHELCSNHIGNFPFPAPPPVLSGIESLFFSLQCCVSVATSAACQTRNAWRTRNQRHGFMVRWHL